MQQAHSSGAPVQYRTLKFDNPTLAGWEWPVAEIRGSRPGPRLCVMAGMHVNEGASIEAAVRLLGRVDPRTLRGSLSVIPILNLPAVPLRSQYVCPIDNKNINFSFPGNPRGTFSEALADAVLNEWAADADVLADLHGGDLCEALATFSICQLTGDAAFDERNLALARCFDGDLIATLDPGHMKAPARACTARARARRHAVMSEAGSHGIVDAASVAFHLDGLLNVMSSIGMREEPATPARREQIVLGKYLWLAAPADGLLYPRVGPMSRAAEGDVLATVTDSFGRPLGEIRAPEAGLVMWHITHRITQRGEKVCGLGVPDLV
ncbi:MAG: succinylglutamate desuccinylase/aspartoacylase family protein [Parvibaculaceae bacterium]